MQFSINRKWLILSIAHSIASLEQSRGGKWARPRRTSSVLTFLVGANHAVPLEGVQLPLVAEAEVVARPLEYSDLVDDPARQHDRRADDGGLWRRLVGEPLLEPRVGRLAQQQQTPPGQPPAPARLPPTASHLQRRQSCQTQRLGNHVRWRSCSHAHNAGIQRDRYINIKALVCMRLCVWVRASVHIYERKR